MYSYITSELHAIVGGLGVNVEKSGIFGHSVGGLGALCLGIKNPNLYKSISAFAPVSNPSTSPWGNPQFTKFLGGDAESAAWKECDPTELIKSGALGDRAVLVDVGASDWSWEKLGIEALEAAVAEKSANVTINRREGYDHDFYFISTFIEDHVRYHAAVLNS
jgi:S-formylglutathione hydrolase